MSLRTPLITLASLTAVGTTATTVTLHASQYPYLKYIEFYFYDKEESTSEERIRISLDHLDSMEKMEIYHGSNGSKTYKTFAQVNIGNSNDIGKFKKLFEIANKYLKVQHNLNIIKSLNWNNSNQENLCPKPDDCCCKNKSCDCSKADCSVCLCCYLKEKDNCCKDKCEYEDFNKTQKTFGYLFQNTYASNFNTYFQPIQAHIKLTETSFSELSSTNSSSSDTSQSKTLVGTLVYGFVDYEYKSTKYVDGIIPEDKKSNMVDLKDSSKDSSKDNYFFNIPQKFKFSLKNASAGSGSTSEEAISIDKLLSDLSKKSEILEKSKSPQTKEKKEGTCCFCEAATDLNGVIARNFVALEKNGNNTLTNIQSKIKGIKDFCAAKPK